MSRLELFSRSFDSRGFLVVICVFCRFEHVVWRRVDT